MTSRNNLARILGLACAAVLLAASAQASNYRFGAAQDRVVSDEPHGYTQHVTPDFEVQDGIGVTYMQLGGARVARLVSTEFAAKVYTDVAPLDGADGKITAGDAWISQQAGAGAVSLPVAPTAVERLLFSGARRILYESVPTTVYFARDQLDSMTVETDDQGAVLGRRAYTIWGAERAASGDSDSYGFTGQRQDANGTVHFSYRQLDPATGRWSSADPLFDVATPDGLGAFGEATTSYAYVANNPANAIDPTGLAKIVAVGERRLAKHAWLVEKAAKVANLFGTHDNYVVAKHQYLAVIEFKDPRNVPVGPFSVRNRGNVTVDAGVKNAKGSIEIQRERGERIKGATFYPVPELQHRAEHVERFLKYEVDTGGKISDWLGRVYNKQARDFRNEGNCQGYVQAVLGRYNVHWDVYDRRSRAMEPPPVVAPAPVIAASAASDAKWGQGNAKK